MSSVNLHSAYFIASFLLYFDALTGAQQVIKVSKGETVTLLCNSTFQNSEMNTFKWRKDGKPVCEYFIQNHNISGVVACQPQFMVNPQGLIIINVRSTDAGVYNCSTTRLIPPPSVEKQSSLVSLYVEVPPGLTLEQRNSRDPGCVDLLCSLEGLRSDQVNLTWTRGSDLLLHQNVPTGMNSSLHLCKSHWRDGDTITCHARYSSNHTLYSQNITLTCDNNECSSKTPWLLIGLAVGGCVGLLLVILLIFAFCKCRKKEDTTGSIVFSNKVYENLNFFTSRPNTAPGATINSGPGATINSRPGATISSRPGATINSRPGATINSRPNPQGECQTQREECIYEN